MGGLSDKLGGSLEDLAIETLPAVLAQAWGMDVTGCGRDILRVGDREVELDMIARGSIDARQVVVLGQVKARLTAREVEAFLRVADLVKPALPDTDVRVVFFGFQANLDARQLIRKSGASMVFSNGRVL